MELIDLWKKKWWFIYTTEPALQPVLLPGAACSDVIRFTARFIIGVTPACHLLGIDDWF
jgi:hypothetical protein